jgi:transcriptional regulator
MYTPPHFRLDDPDQIHAMIEEAGLATLVSNGPDGLFATHLPLLHDPDPAPHGTLIGHIARANPHADLAGPALAILSGPDGYISPSWYAEKPISGKVVPTWNYVALHAYGTLELFTDPDRLLGVVTRLTEAYEAKRDQPWSVSDAPADFIAGMLKSIIGVAIPIKRLEAKAKLSQNRSTGDRARVIAGLPEVGGGDLARVMARIAPP